MVDKIFKYVFITAFAVYTTVTSVLVYGVVYEVNSKLSGLSEVASTVMQKMEKLPTAVPTPPKVNKPKVQNIPKLGPFPDGGNYLFGR